MAVKNLVGAGGVVRAWVGVALCLGCLQGCVKMGGIDMSPAYRADRWIVPATWRGPDPFVPATPSDAALRRDWWQLFDDPVLNQLEERALHENADLHVAAERFVQARDEMMKARAQLLPKLGFNVGASDDRQSAQTLYATPNTKLRDGEVSLGGMASWEPDFWSKLRNKTKVEIFRAEQVAAQYALVRLGLQAELASAYFTLRGLDAQNAIYQQSIVYYQESLDLVMVKFRGQIASELDVARAEYQLSSSQARQFNVQARRQVVEHALATLVNVAPAGFRIAPREDVAAAALDVPVSMPSTLLQRRPDIASAERHMAQANKTIGIARAAFFPNIPLGINGGTAGLTDLFKRPNFFWSLGAFLKWPVFSGGYGRAQLQQAWSMYRESENAYRGTLLRAFQEVEDGMSLTQLTAKEMDRQNAAVAAALKQQELSTQLYRGGLVSSLDLITSQVNALEARVRAAEVKANLRKSTVALFRSLGGGWDRSELPGDDAVQPFGVFQAKGLGKPEPAGGIDVETEGREAHENLATPISF